MPLRKTASLFAGLALASALVAAALATPPVSAASGDEGKEELVPGLDLWSESHRPPSYWNRDATADLLPRAERHRMVMQAGVPLEYRSRRNPYPQAQMAIDDGGQLYGLHCKSCHGANGSGDGKAGRDLTPSPAFLAYLIKRPRAVDEYLLWTISEGGVPFDSEMPAFKDRLDERQIWQIVTYMRADFPEIEPAAGE